MPPTTNAPTPFARVPAARIEPRQRMAVLLCILALFGFSGGLESFASWGPFGNAQSEVTAYLDSSEKKAVEAFAVARMMNAAISFLKSADLSIVLIQAEPMEVLEPIDDLAKQFSDVMVISIVSILVQRLLLAISQAWALSVAFPIGCGLLALSCYRFRSPTAALRLAALGRSIVLLSLFARFAVTAAGLAGATITNQFLASDLDASISGMHESGGSLQLYTDKAAEAATNAESAPPSSAPTDDDLPQSAFGQAARMARATVNTTQALIKRGEAFVRAGRNWIPDKATIDALLTDLPARILRAIEIFLVQTLVTPLAVAWFFYAMLKGAIRPVAVRIETAGPAAPPLLTHAAA